MRIELIGKPRIVAADGEVRPVRGHKAWCVLARVVLSERPTTRQRLATELFPDADDPLAALRWCLVSLRKALDQPDALVGDPIRLDLSPDTTIDAIEVLAGRIDDIAEGELLEGIEPAGCPDFATWLLVARRTVAGRMAGGLHAAAIEALALERPEVAADRAARLARLTPFDDRAHIVLVHALVSGGHSRDAEQHVTRVEAMYLDELGIAPSAELRLALDRPLSSTSRTTPHATVRARLDVARAALAAGVSAAALDDLRHAAALADGAGNDHLLAEAWYELGSALVHTQRGTDDEGSVLLQRAAELGRRVGDSALTSRALRERGYVEALAGRRHQAVDVLDAAEEAAGGDMSLLADVWSIQAFNLGDWGKFDESVGVYRRALDAARTCGNRRRETWILSLGAWALLRHGTRGEARSWATAAVAAVRELRWTSFEPWPELVLTELAYAEGQPLAEHRDRLERIFALSCQIGDPCWEAAASRQMALFLSREGDVDQALSWADDARRRAARTSDVWGAMVGEVKFCDAKVRVDARLGDDASPSIERSISHAVEKSLDELLARSLTLLERT